MINQPNQKSLITPSTYSQVRSAPIIPSHIRHDMRSHALWWTSTVLSLFWGIYLGSSRDVCAQLGWVTAATSLYLCWWRIFWGGWWIMSGWVSLCILCHFCGNFRVLESTVRRLRCSCLPTNYWAGSHNPIVRRFSTDTSRDLDRLY